MAPVDVGQPLGPSFDLLGCEVEATETEPQTALALDQRLERLVRFRRLEQCDMVRQTSEYRAQHLSWQVQKRHAIFIRFGRLNKESFFHDKLRSSYRDGLAISNKLAQAGYSALVLEEQCG